MISGTKYEYRIESDPSGAKVSVYRGNASKMTELVTPAVYVIDMSENTYFKFEYPGYKPTYYIPKRDFNPVVLPGCILVYPAIVDFMTGAFQKPENGKTLIHITLIKEESSGILKIRIQYIGVVDPIYSESLEMVPL